MSVGIAAGTAIGIVVGVPLGAFVAYVLYRLTRSRRQFTYKVEKRPLVRITAHARSDEKLDIRYAGQSVADVYAFDVRLRNTGNHPIELPTFYVQLDSGARLFRLEVEPRGQAEVGEVTVMQPDGSSQGSLTLGQVNESDEVTVRAVAANAEASDCRLRIVMPGVQCNRSRFLTIGERLAYAAGTDPFPQAVALMLATLVIAVATLVLALISS